MDYKQIYNRLIEYRRQNILTCGYIERHHIVPKSLGGTDDESNIVALSGREHYIAHLLLSKFNRCSQTAYALWAMQMKSSKTCDRPCIKSGRMYEWARKEFIKYASHRFKITSKGECNSQYDTKWITNGIVNLKVSKDYIVSEEWKFGRTVKKKQKHFTCAACNSTFSNKKKKKYCCKQCENNSKPNIIKDNFDNLKLEYEKHKCLSRAFNSVGIAYNSNLFKKFIDLYNHAEVA
jgi:hypothetical protein